MERVNYRDSYSGIYCIRNIITNKVYIGKSKNIARRISSHIHSLNSKTSSCTKLQNSWISHGGKSFEYFVLEKVDKNIENFESLLQDREIYWQTYFNSIENRYNLIKESKDRRFHHISTIEKFKKKIGILNPNYGNKWPEYRKKALSIKKKDMYKSGIIKPLNQEKIKKMYELKMQKWKENPELIRKMVEKCNVTKIKYKIHQLDENNNLIKIWNNILELSKAHPEYKRHNIYAVCSGEKKRIYGYKWKKVLKK